MPNNRLTVFENTPFTTAVLSPFARTELENLLSQSVYVYGDNEILDCEDKYIFTPVRGNRLISRRYVGVIQTSDGSTVEILPKIFKELNFKDATSNQQNKARKLLLRMLEKAGLVSYRKSTAAMLEIGDFSLMEVFIHSFLKETQELARKGLRRDYITIEENLTTLKGRIHFPRHVRENLAICHKHYCRYDDYSTECIENRILVTTLQKTVRISRDSQNKKLASQLLPLMDGISTIHLPEKRHFDQCRNDRHMRYYAEALRTACYILLSPPTPTTGGESTTAILFNMANLFEKTIERSLMEDNAVSQLTAQKRIPWFNGLGTPRPDYFFHEDGIPVVADAKWKLPQDGNPNSSDQYQLFSYMQVLGTKKAYILYPKTGEYGVSNSTTFEFDWHNDRLSLHTIPFSLDTFAIQR